MASTQNIGQAVVEGMQACIDHAKALLESAHAVQSAGHPNIAYHLAVLALEELGRRELIGLQGAAARHPELAVAWTEKRTQNHVQKLFWCFFGGHFFEKVLTSEALDSMRGLAKHLHAKRLEGLYVEQDEDGLHIPAEAIDLDEGKRIIDLAEARLALASAQELRDDITEEEQYLQTWFLRIANDTEGRRFIFSKGSMSKLSELKNVLSWVGWLKEELDKQTAENIRLWQIEVERSRNVSGVGTKAKWKVRIRIYSDSHSIRSKELATWNKTVDWIKLVAVPEKKNQLIVEFTLRDNVPVQALWHFAWGLARHFVVALNIGSMGFWSWRMPVDVNKYYESIEDLEAKAKVVLERSPSLKVDWGEHRVLTSEDLGKVSACFTALPGPNNRNKHGPFNYYIGGLTFLSLNDVHWQCESTVFGNFFECLREMMAEVGEWRRGEPFEPVFKNYLLELISPEDEDLHKIVEIARAAEAGTLDKVTVTLREASFAKLFCDAYFLKKLLPRSSTNSEA